MRFRIGGDPRSTNLRRVRRGTGCRPSAARASSMLTIPLAERVGAHSGRSRGSALIPAPEQSKHRVQQSPAPASGTASARWRSYASPVRRALDAASVPQWASCASGVSSRRIPGGGRRARSASRSAAWPPRRYRPTTHPYFGVATASTTTSSHFADSEHSARHVPCGACRTASLVVRWRHTAGVR